MSALGHKQTLSEGLRDVRYSTESGHRLKALRRPLSAKSSRAIVLTLILG